MIIERFSDVTEATAKASTLPFAFIREYSRVLLGCMPQAFDVSATMEARFFDEQTEIRLFRDESGVLQAVQLTAEPTDSFIDHTYSLINPTLFGNTLSVREYLTADEDGQMIVTQICLTKWEGATVHGC